MFAAIHRNLLTKTSRSTNYARLREVVVRPWLGTVNQTNTFARPITVSSGRYRTQQDSEIPTNSPLNVSSDNDNYTQAKPYKDIPGPWKIPLLQLTPELLKSDPYKSVQLTKKLQKKYGSLFKARFSPTMPEFVVVFDPKDVAKIFRNDGQYPIRYPVDVWGEIRGGLGILTGLFLSDGEDWQEQRRPISKFMMMPRKVAEYHESFNEVTFDLIKKIKKSRDESGNLLDATTYFHKWSFESVGFFVLGKRLGCLEDQIPPDCQEFIDATHLFNSASHKLLFGLPLHKLYRTKNMDDIKAALKSIYDVSMSHIKERLEEIKEEDAKAVENEGDDQEPAVGVDFITYMSKARKMPLERITANAIDLMAAGIDTTSLTLLWTLYSLARNPEVQDKVRSEIQQAVGSNSIVTPAHIQQMPYMRDCIRETQRLYSIVPNNTRMIQKDLVLSGYTVPARTIMLMPTIGAGSLEDNFHDPDKFIPDRWTREHMEPTKLFASLPFGFGLRMCAGRRIAELTMHVALAQLIKNFQVEYKGENPMDYIMTVFLMPEGRFDLAFVDL